VRPSVVGFLALACMLTGCSGSLSGSADSPATSSVHYGMTTCPDPAGVGRAVMTRNLRLAPNSAPIPPGQQKPLEFTCNYFLADQYQAWLNAHYDGPSVGIDLFPKSMVTQRLLQAFDASAALRGGAAVVSGRIMLAGKETPVIFAKTGNEAKTVQWLPDGGYSVLQIQLSSGETPRSAPEFRSELQDLARLSGLQ